MKQEIINATKEEIRIKGLAFTMDDIVSHLGISKKTIYQHVSSKKEIIGEILIEMNKDMERQQIALFNDDSISILQKMKDLMKISPSQDDLITPITLNQLKKSFPKLYKMVVDIYHFDWDRFTALYDEALEQGLIKPFDILFFKEVYITAVTNLPEVPAMNKYSYSEIVDKLVEQLFNGIGN